MHSPMLLADRHGRERALSCIISHRESICTQVSDKAKRFKALSTLIAAGSFRRWNERTGCSTSRRSRITLQCNWSMQHFFYFIIFNLKHKNLNTFFFNLQFFQSKECNIFSIESHVIFWANAYYTSAFTCKCIALLFRKCKLLLGLKFLCPR